MKCPACGVKNKGSMILCAECGRPLRLQDAKTPSQKTTSHSGRPIVVVAALLVSFSIGYFLRHGSFDRGRRRDPVGLSYDFRRKVTPAYVSLTHMESLSSDDPSFLKEQFNAEKSLVDASPTVRTLADTEAYAFLKRWLASSANESGYERLLDEHPNASGALDLMAFYRQRHENCEAAASIYFEPPSQNADSKAEESYKHECMREFPKYQQPSRSNEQAQGRKDVAQEILEPLHIPEGLKAEAWDAYYQAKNGDDFDQRFKKLGLPNEIKAELREKRFPK